MKKILAVVLLLLSPSLMALTLDDYLDQVTKQNQGYVASQKNVEAGKLKKGEGEIAISYNLFSNIQYANDKRESNFSFVTGDRTSVTTYSLGINKMTTFGLTAALSYNINYSSLHGANPTFLTSSNYYQTNPQLDLSQSFWRNAFGRQTRATIEAVEAKSLSGAYTESYKSKMMLAEAESLYWKLSLQRDLVKIQKDSLTRAEKLRDWSKRRSSLNLADRSDFLQAEANYKMRQMDLADGMDDEKELVRQFNTVRGIQSDELVEDLDNLTVDKVDALNIPERKGLRDDVRALKEAARASAANAKLSKDKNAPQFDMFASLSLNGRDSVFNTSFKDSWGGNYPYTVVGLKFSTPLDFGNIGRINSGYEAEKIAAEYAYQRKQYEMDRDWNNFVKKVDEAKQRLKIAAELEDLQNKKFQYEQQRHQRGQTTTYQVLMFEQDYANSQLNRIKFEGEILQLIAQMKTFSGKEEL